MTRASASGTAVTLPRQPRAATTLFVAPRVLRRITLAAVAATILAYPATADASPWIAPGVGLSVFALWHALEAGREVPWIPGLVLVGACVQWILAAWGVYRVQSLMPIPAMAVPPRDYFSFAVPATLALALGIYWPLRRPGRRGDALRYRPPRAPASFARTCDYMVAGGTLMRVFGLAFAPLSIRFAVNLLCLLAFVGALGLLLVRAPGWWWRMLLVTSWMFFYQAVDLQFLEALLWSILVALTLLYRFRPRLRLVLPFAIAGSMVFLSINAFKTMHRDTLRQEGLSQNERAARSGSIITSLLRQPDLLASRQNLGGQVSRLNEGWVIARIMAWVPTAEPYARGETVVDGLRSALIPRLVDPNKTIVGGALSVPRFTGMTLINGTSIGLSVPGELYANFGRDGAIAGCLVYGLAIGWLYALFVRRGRLSPLWWAWAPFVLFTPTSSEQDFSTVVNQITKAALVMAAVVAFAPGWRELRRGRLRAETVSGPRGTRAAA